MHSIQKLFYPPEAHTDFISVIAELGLVGTPSAGVLLRHRLARATLTVHAPDRSGVRWRWD
jgi:cell division protein FtsW (lipid II flippase)